MVIPDEKITEIRERSDIVEIVSEYVHLKKSGKNFIGLCPFHSEKTPSFTVNREKGIFYCFGCHEGGDIFTFLMKIRNISFSESVFELARIYNIRIDVRKGKSDSIRDEILRINKIAADYFFNTLQGKEGEEGRRYITYRKLSREIVEGFYIGYAPDEWRSLFNYLQKKGFSVELMEKAGLIIETRDGNYYDRFRNRIVFPVREVDGSIVGFGSRSIDESEPKYMNSPETPVFIKGRVLYGIHECRDFIDKDGRVFVVEGYFDLLTLYQAGVRNVVALCGTALGVNHLRRLKKFARDICLVFDGDEAGMRALARSLQLFIDEDVDGRAVVLPHGYDPDSFIKDRGKNAFDILSEKAPSLFETVLDYFISETAPQDFDGKKKIMEMITPYIVSVRNPIERERWIRLISESIGLREEVVREFVALKKGSGGSEFGIDGLIERQEPPQIDPVEKGVLQVVLHHPEYIKLIMERGAISYIKDDRIRDLLMELSGSPDSIDIQKGLSQFDEKTRGIISRLIIENPPWEEEPGDFLKGCILKLQERYIREQMKGLLNQLKEAQEDRNEEAVEKILRDINRLKEIRRKNGKIEKGEGNI